MSTLWVVVETSCALVALLAALLVVGRFRTSSMVTHLALVQAFVVLAVANLLPNILPALVESGDRAESLRLRLQAVCGVLGALSLAVAALAGEARLGRRQVSLGLAMASGLVAPALGLALLDRLEVELPGVVALRSLHVLAGVLFVLAALAFGFRRSQHDDQLRRHLALGGLLAAAARLLYVIDPLPAGVAGPHIGDTFRFGFYAVLLAGAVQEIRSYWQRMAVQEERRRLARDLHDGVAQELAFIATEAARTNPRPDQLFRIGSAATRALDESRRAISALSRPLEQRLDEAVAEAAEEVAGRVGVRLRLDLASGVEVTPAVREALVRILREAVGNAAKHANADCISVVLAHDPRRLRLQVIDDGHGFADSTKADRLGITTMTERATAIGGALSIATEIGTGTVVEVELPIASPA